MTILQKIKYKLKSISILFLIKFSLVINSPKLTAFVFSLIAAQKRDPGKLTVLCLGRTVFLDDIKAMQQFSGQLNYVVVHLKYWGIIFSHLTRNLPDSKKILENNYHNENFFVQGKKIYYSYLEKMLPWLLKFIKFDVILSGNFSYVWQQELARLCQNENFPFIVLHKEGLTVGIYKDAEELYCGCKFYGAKILVYNNKVIKALVGKDRIRGATPDKVKVVGMPRMDYYFHQKHNHAQNQIVFFSFYTRYRFPRLIKDPQKLKEVEERSLSFHKWVMNFASKHKNINIIIKTKSANYYLDYVQDIYKNNFKKQINNLTITNSCNPIELIKSSKAVIGFSSMSLIESIIANKPIFSPYYGDFVPDQPWDYFGEYPKMIEYIKTESELTECLLAPEKYINYSREERNDFLAKFISTPDGQASIRTEEEIIKTIKEYKSYA